MSAKSGTSGARQQRLTSYLDRLTEAAGHADRAVPLKLYCTGLLLPGERKSVEPMAARLAPENVRRIHQSLHHVVADAAWSDEALLGCTRDYALAAMTKTGPVAAWIVDDTGLPKKGTHSVGVARQYCGQTGKKDNCQVAVSLSVATWTASLPVAYRLYLPEQWVNDSQLRQQAKIPNEIAFQTKLQIALGQIRQAIADGIPQGTVLADPAYGNDTGFRQAVAKLQLSYVLGIQSRAPRCGTCTGISQATGAELAGQGMENRDMAGRYTASPALPLRPRAHPPCTSGSQAPTTARTGVAADRVAPRRNRTAQILVVEPGRKHPIA
jgi:SRSO17 transposase